MKRQSYNDPGHAHYLTFTCYRRRQLLNDNLTRTLLIRALDHARKLHHFKLWAWVSMPEHVHLLLHPMPESYSMTRILRSIKGPSARRIITAWRHDAPHKLDRLRVPAEGKTVFRFWQAGGGYDRNVFQIDPISKAIEYIEHNPVRRGLVSEAMDWPWSSARARAGEEDIPITIDEVKFVDLPSNKHS